MDYYEQAETIRETCSGDPAYLVSDGFTLYGAAVTVCFGGRFERTLDFGDVADSNIPNVGGELVIDTTTLIDNVL